MPKHPTAFYAAWPGSRNNAFRDSVVRVYSSITHLRPGSVAPGFTLKNDKGENVSLSDFRGKTVYIDFWGTSCGPCRVDIADNAAGAHNKYRGRVIFLNICVDAGPAEWKRALTELHLGGINLLAEGRTNDPVSKAYVVDAIPHYVLVDKNGRIVNNEASRLQDLVARGENELDRALSPSKD